MFKNVGTHEKPEYLALFFIYKQIQKIRHCFVHTQKIAHIHIMFGYDGASYHNAYSIHNTPYFSTHAYVFVWESNSVCKYGIIIDFCDLLCGFFTSQSAKHRVETIFIPKSYRLTSQIVIDFFFSLIPSYFLFIILHFFSISVIFGILYLRHGMQTHHQFIDDCSPRLPYQWRTFHALLCKRI